MSSAKSIVKSLSDILARSLIRIKNRIGPSTEPSVVQTYTRDLRGVHFHESNFLFFPQRSNPEA